MSEIYRIEQEFCKVLGMIQCLNKMIEGDREGKCRSCLQFFSQISDHQKSEAPALSRGLPSTLSLAVVADLNPGARDRSVYR